MCGGKPKVDTSYQDFARAEAERTRAEEVARQDRIAQGMKAIQAVFDGGTVAPVGAAAAPQIITVPGTAPTAARVDQAALRRALARLDSVGGSRNQQEVERLSRGTPAVAGTPDMYEVNGQRFATMQEAQAAMPRPTTTAGSPTTFAGVEPLLDQREAAMRGFFLPQLDEKRAKALEQLTFALSRAGLLTSSVAGQKQAELGDQYSLEKAGILSKVAADRAGTRTALNQQRSSIEAALRASGDVSAATNQALSTTSGFEVDQPELNPLGDVFYGIASGIGAAKQGQQVAAVRRSMTPNPLRAGAGRNVA